jgi:hypothetical protein
VPYVPSEGLTGVVLKQNTDRQAAIIRHVSDARREHGDSLLTLKTTAKPWRALVSKVAQVGRVMPLWKLQTVGGQTTDFLCPNVGRGQSITLRPGVAFCLRQFHSLVTELVRSSWLHWGGELLFWQSFTSMRWQSKSTGALVSAPTNAPVL